MINDDNFLVVERFNNTDRSEEVRDIIDRMPESFAFWISLLVLIISVSLFIFGWTVRYPDIVTGQITVSASLPPVKLIASTPGKLRLFHDRLLVPVKSGEVVAYIESSTSYDTLQMIKQILATYNPNNLDNVSILARLPAQVSLGEFSSKYYNFYNSLYQLKNFTEDKLYDNQIGSLEILHTQQIKEILHSSDRAGLNRTTLEYAERFLRRDSILHADRVTSDAEYDKTKMSYLSSSAGYSNAKSTLVEAERQAQQTRSKIAEVAIQKSEKRKELEISLLASYNDFMESIMSWEQKYLFRAPFEGKAQFLRFWTNKQYVQSGESVFSIIPNSNRPYGQVFLPATGAGKVENGQEVIIKLDNFPFNEYGTIVGIIKDISLTTTTLRVGDGEIETYLVIVEFPKGLNTSYGQQVVFQHESKGVAEIITRDRRLIQRLFDNLSSVVKKR